MIKNFLNKIFKTKEVEVKCTQSSEVSLDTNNKKEEIEKMKTRKDMKKELKQLAADIKKNKIFWRKFKHSEFAEQFKDLSNKERWEAQDKAMKDLIAAHPCDPREYRHMHIAYGLLRGLKYEQIEQKTRPNNKPDMAYVEKLVQKYKGEEEKVPSEQSA